MVIKNIIPTKRQQTTEKRRTLLVDSAIECFVENGISQTGIRDIAKKADVSVGNLYNHFASKDKLIAEIAIMETDGLHVILEKVNLVKDPLKSLYKFADEYLNYVADPIASVLTVEITSESLRNEDVANLFDGNRQLLVDCLVALIQRIRGEQRETIDETVSRKLSELLIDSIEGMGLRFGLSGKSPSKTDRDILKSTLMNSIGVKVND